MLEITERTDARKELLLPEAARLRGLGFKLALDDVGAGNAGLEMLQALPVDFIKIDRAVVANAVEDRRARAVMLGIMAFARESGSFVIAEGIETEAMLELARDPDPEREARPVGAHGAQGFLLGRPAPVPSESPSYQETLATLTELTADRERRRIAAALQRGDELYRVLLRTVPDMAVALFDRDLRCQAVDGGLGALERWREMLVGKTLTEALGDDADGDQMDALLRPVLERRAARLRVGRPPQRHPPLRAGRPGARCARRRDRRDGGVSRRHAAPRGRRRAALVARPADRRPRSRALAPSGVQPRKRGTVPRMADVAMPRLSDSMEEGTILKWLKSDGDEVKRGEELVEIETDKANMTYEADSDGTLTIVAKEGDTLPVGETIARLGDRTEAGDEPSDEGGEETGDDEAPAEEEDAGRQQAEDESQAEPEAEEDDTSGNGKRDEAPAPAPAQAEAPSGNGGGDRVKASPVAKRMAREMGVELGRLKGSGPGGRIVKADVEAAAKGGAATAEAEAPPQEAAPPSPRRRRPPRPRRRRPSRTSPRPSSPATSRPAAARPRSRTSRGCRRPSRGGWRSRRRPRPTSSSPSRSTWRRRSRCASSSRPPPATSPPRRSTTS